MLIKLTDNDKMGGRKVPASNQTIKEEGHGEWGMGVMGAQLHPGSNTDAAQETEKIINTLKTGKNLWMRKKPLNMGYKVTHDIIN